MLRKSFNDNWQLSKGESFFSPMGGPQAELETVTLPHDAMILEKRDAGYKNKNNTGFFPGGVYVYTKKFHAPEEYVDKVVMFEFEGVYMNAMVYINGDFAGKCPYGYSNFYVNAYPFLKLGGENEIKVISRTSSENTSRWYSGSGIYRDVKLIIGEQLHIKVDGVKISTADIENDQAVVEISTAVEYNGIPTQNVCVYTEIQDSEGRVVASDKAPITAFARETVNIKQRVYIQDPMLWSIDTPNLYYCYSKIIVNDKVVDEDKNHLGIRKLQLDTKYGLRINGEVVKLRGSCIHHDNGVIGAATFQRAEERRVEIMKEAGFNAIRSAHQPMSKAMLDACDRMGILVMDEAFDMWCISKSEYDYALYFNEWWEKDIQAMVDKDYNHPCVIMYSIGNEIPESGTRIGAGWSRKIAEKVRSLDQTRYTINSINGMLSVMDRIEEIVASITGKEEEVKGENKEINNMMTEMMSKHGKIVSHELVAKTTEESYASVDIAGYNYMFSRYELDGKLYPNRIICGSETMPPDIDLNWKLVKANSHVIGDFTWTGWDYIGESGVGVVDHTSGGTSFGFKAEYPCYLAYVGDIDITGNRRPSSYYKEIVWGLRKEPYIAVQRPEHYADVVQKTPWAWSDSISSWTWPGFEEKPVKVEVYSDAEEVELLLNGKSVGKAAAGEENRFKAIFDTVYEAGELTAIAYVNGEETGRMVLQTAGNSLELKVDCDREVLEATEGDLAYVMISLTDDKGILQSSSDRKVSVKVEGAGTLQGFGSADPMSTENFYDTERTTFDGKVLAVVRSKAEAGTITVTVSAEGCASKVISICNI